MNNTAAFFAAFYDALSSSFVSTKIETHKNFKYAIIEVQFVLPDGNLDVMIRTAGLSEKDGSYALHEARDIAEYFNARLARHQSAEELKKMGFEVVERAATRVHQWLGRAKRPLAAEEVRKREKELFGGSDDES